MSFMDKVTAGAERAVKEAEKAFDKSRAKVGELQVEMQMDSQAKKLGYLVFDFYRGREVDQDLRQHYLDELSRLEDELIEVRAEAAARKQAAAAGAAAAGGAGASDAGAAPGPEGEAGGAAGAYPPVPDVEPDCTMPADSSEAARESTEETFKEGAGWQQGDA